MSIKELNTSTLERYQYSPDNMRLHFVKDATRRGI
jgi:hypothetical protein